MNRKGIPTSEKRHLGEIADELPAKTKRAPARESGLWNDESFRQRVERFANERGRSGAEVCRAAGLSRDYLLKAAGTAGRSIEALMRIARELGITLPELVGQDEPTTKESDEALERLLIVAEVASHLYLALAARPSTGDLTRKQILDAVLEIIERQPDPAMTPAASESAPQ